jgi:hypothetical protein
LPERDFFLSNVKYQQKCEIIFGYLSGKLTMINCLPYSQIWLSRASEQSLVSSPVRIQC